MCYSNRIHAYHLGCLVWKEDVGSQPKNEGNPRLGHLGHVAVRRGNDTLVIVGGFHGTVSSDVVAVKLSNRIIDSEALSKTNSSSISNLHSYCSNLTISECKEDPECVFCDVPEAGIRECLYYLHRSACPSPAPLMACDRICSGAFTSCTSCVSAKVWWPEDAPQQCGWCALDQKCYPVSNVNDQCGKSQLPGNSSLLMANEQCQKEDVPPGLIQSCSMVLPLPKSLSDANFKQLERVTRLNNGEVSASGDVTDTCEWKEWTLCKAEGFIRPLPFPKSAVLPQFYSMQLSVNQVWRGEVRLGINETTMNSQVVQAASSDVFSSVLPIVSDNTEHRYYIAIYGAVACERDRPGSGSMKVMWNGDLQSFNGTHVRCLFSIKFLS